MKTLNLILGVLLMTVFMANAQNETKPAPQGTPQIKFDEISFDFGEIIEGTQAIHSFTFTNVGTGPLKIIKAQPSCGCTISDWTKDTIPPGGKGYVKALFHSDGYGGRSFAKSITVTTNMPVNPDVYLTFSGKVASKQVQIPQYPVTLLPVNYNFGKVNQGKTVSWTVELTNQGDSALVIKQVKCKNPLITAKFSSKTAKRGEKLTINFSFQTKQANPGIVNEIITFVTNVPEINTKSISINGFSFTGEVLKK